ncbi:hypothetical protein AQUCO_06900004v1 [Aquilegia coerulea]|uniref:RCC1-like domain-containing protein n=1 Tax=Aquilegia coerulea TaxID=218851 RepID=A0A2G5CAZ2_AQUCA|nr:hypothetical protein AQUCO_06900004v1 [Aquilegia coerulea]
MWKQKLKNVSKLGLGFSRRWISIEKQVGGIRRKRFAALWGNGDYGRLGLGKVDSQWSPTVCSALENQNLKAISCGGAHTLFLTEAGRVYATGLNDYGQLGISPEKSYTLEPLEISGLPEEIIRVSAGYHHSSAITANGVLYMWGNNSSGQLGLGKRAAKKVSKPSRVDCLNNVRIKMVALGSEHSIAITDEGEALSWGAGGSGRLGHGHQSSILGFLRSSSFGVCCNQNLFILFAPWSYVSAVNLHQGLSKLYRGTRLKLSLRDSCIQLASTKMALYSYLAKEVCISWALEKQMMQHHHQ